MLDITITLFSSDSRPQYAKDVFNILALPNGGIYRLRYKEKYIHSDIIGDLDNSKINGTIALIAFRTNKDAFKNEHFFAPVRWALIKKVRKIADFYLIDFIVRDFAVFNKEFDDNRRNFEDINSLAKKYFTTNDKVEAFVTTNTPNIVIAYNNAKNKNNVNETERWLKVIEVLHMYPKFENCYFFKVSILRSGLSKIFNSSVIQEGGRTNISVDYNNFCDISDSEINIEYDECLLVPSGDKKTKIECRYDCALFGFQAKGVLSKTPTQIILNCRSSQDIETKIKIPLQIKRNYFFLVTHVIFSLAGAVLIGLPAILPDTTPIATTVSMFIAGSLFIAFNWLIPYKE